MVSNSAPAAAGPPPAPGQRGTRTFYFLFGPDHVLRNGKIEHLDPALGGMSLGRFYLPVHAATEDEARARVTETFGPMWASVYPGEAGRTLVRRHALHPLFRPEAMDALSALRICTCGVPGHPHCPGWHDTYDDPEVLILRTFHDHAPACPYQHSGEAADCSCGRSPEEARR